MWLLAVQRQPDIRRLTQVEDEQLSGSPLLGAIRRFVPGAHAFLFSLSPTPEEVAQAVERARSGDVDVVVLGTFNAHLDDRQAALVDAVVDTGVPTIVVAMRNPYDIEKLPSAKAYLATYSFRECAMQAAAEVVFGVTKPKARLPVTIPGKYARGTGLNG
ncbi:MAG TPA: glycoside hydrolase family 3 C-terminal domain-containing protein [Limnochordales bacterium]